MEATEAEGQEWQERIARGREAGQSVSAMAKEHRVAKSTVYTWMRRLGVASWARTTPKGRKPAVTLARVARRGGVAVAQRKEGVQIEIGAARIALGADTDVRLVARLLCAIAEGP